MKRTSLFLLVLVSSVAATQPPRAPSMDPAANALLERADRGRTLGNVNARVWLVEVSDFQCPYCKQWHDSTFAAINREFIETGLVRMAYVNYPVQGHIHAVAASEAAMCASAQDRFWPLHDRLFKTQPRWSPMKDTARVIALFDSLAVASGVNAAEYRSCVSSRVTRRLIRADQDRSQRAGINGTPHFFVGDEAISGMAPFEALQQAILRAAAGSATRRP